MHWEDYHSSADFGRHRNLQELVDWSNLIMPERVCSVVAPPGTGKTWLLKAARRKWEQATPATADSMPRILFEVDVSLLVNKEQTVRERMLNQDQVLGALIAWRKTALDYCISLKEIDRDGDIALSVRSLVTQVCDACKPEHSPLVLVDGYDEVPPRCNEIVDEQILEPFFSKECIGLIVARRTDRRLASDILHRNQKIIPLDRLPDPLEQFKRFRDTYYQDSKKLTIKNFERWKAQLTFYKWNHPFINAYLFDKALHPTGNKKLTAQDLRGCCRALIERPDENGNRRHSLDDALFELLLEIANAFRDKDGMLEWTADQFEEKLERNFRDRAITPLFDLGALEMVKGKPLFYKIMDGLGELLVEIYVLEHPSKKRGGGA